MKTLLGHARDAGGHILVGHGITSGPLYGPELTAPGSQTVRNATGSQTDGVWSITATGNFANIAHLGIITPSTLYRVVGAWSANDERRQVYVNLGGTNLLISNAVSGSIDVEITSSSSNPDAQIYFNGSVSGDTFSVTMSSIKVVL